MELILLDASKAATFGLPQSDSTMTTLIAGLCALGWVEQAARRHVANAIAAGVYRKIEKSPASEMKYETSVENTAYVPRTRREKSK
jgi:hypothetical protein